MSVFDVAFSAEEVDMPLGKILKKKKATVLLRKKPSQKSAPETDYMMDHDGILDEDEIIQGAVRSLHERGLRLPTRPLDRNGEPLEIEFPSDLTLLTDEELGRLQSALAAMVDYAGTQLALQDTRQGITADNEKTQRVLNELGGGERSIKGREKSALVNRSTRQRSLAYHYRVAEYKLLKMVYEGYVFKAKAVSREQTRRDTAVKIQGREP